MPDDLEAEIDDRRHSTTPRSRWINEACRARLLLEDEGEWDDLEAEIESQASDDAPEEQQAAAEP